MDRNTFTLPTLVRKFGMLSRGQANREQHRQGTPVPAVDLQHILPLEDLDKTSTSSLPTTVEVSVSQTGAQGVGGNVLSNAHETAHLDVHGGKGGNGR
jgi:hypothetical protein